MIKKKKKATWEINKANYIKEYHKDKYKMFAFKVRKDDEDVMNKLESVQNRSKYLTDLVKEDIKKEGN